VYSMYGGGHCRGGIYGGCDRTFRTDSAANAHRVGPHHPRGLRRCLTDEEMAEAGWRLTDRGWTNEPEMDSALKDRLKGHRVTTEAVSPKGGTDVQDSHEKPVAVPSRPAEEASGSHGFRFGLWRHRSKKG